MNNNQGKDNWSLVELEKCVYFIGSIGVMCVLINRSIRSNTVRQST